MPSHPLALHDLFTANRICTDIESIDKPSLFAELVDLIAETSSGTFDRVSALACLMEREALMSTGIRKGIAVPHGKSTSFSRMYGAIGVSKRGVAYDALDGAPVHVAFMIVSPKLHSETHLKTLKLLARLLDIPGFVDAILVAKDSVEAHRCIVDFEERLGSA